MSTPDNFACPPTVMPDLGPSGKLCTKCGEWKPWDEFSTRPGRPNRASHCKACHREYQRQAKQSDPEHARKLRREAQRRYAAAHPEYAQERYAQMREAVFDHYGRACACCGAASDLSIDHPAGDGSAHRIELFGSRNAAGQRMYAWLIAQGFPDGFQVLCLPCNKSKSDGPACRMHR